MVLEAVAGDTGDATPPAVSNFPRDDDGDSGLARASIIWEWIEEVGVDAGSDSSVCPWVSSSGTGL